MISLPHVLQKSSDRKPGGGGLRLRPTLASLRIFSQVTAAPSKSVTSSE